MDYAYLPMFYQPAPKDSTYPSKCLNHHKAMDIISGDMDKFTEDEIPKWISAVQKHFGDNPIMQQNSEDKKRAKAFSIGSNLDFMKEMIFPRLETSDQATSLLVCKSWGKVITEEMWKPDIPWKYLRKLLVKGTKKKVKIYRMVEGSSSKVLVQYKCACQIWYNLVRHNVSPWWLTSPAPKNLEETFLMDFTTAKRKGEGESDRLFFQTTFSCPRRMPIDHLRTMEEVTFRELLNDIDYDH